jgi:hypothetical protein
MELKRKELGKDGKPEAEGKKESPSVAKQVSPPPGAGKEQHESPPAIEEAVSGDAASKGGADDVRPDEVAVGGRVWFGSGKILRFGAPTLFLLLVAAGILFMRFGAHTGFCPSAQPRLEPVTSIMRPIPTPDYREVLDFLLVCDTDGQRMLTAIRIEIGFQNPTRHQNFKDHTVAFRDTVYSFLLQQNLSRNTVKSWQTILGQDLLDCLKVKLPQSYADMIRLVQVENL